MAQLRFALRGFAKAGKGMGGSQRGYRVQSSTEILPISITSQADPIRATASARSCQPRLGQPKLDCYSNEVLRQAKSVRSSGGTTPHARLAGFVPPLRCSADATADERVDDAEFSQVPAAITSEINAGIGLALPNRNGEHQPDLALQGPNALGGIPVLVIQYPVPGGFINHSKLV
jgi:hypothetical protein